MSVNDRTERRIAVIGSGFIAAELALSAQAKWGWDVHVLYRNFRNPRLDKVPTSQLPGDVSGVTGVLEDIGPTDVVIVLGSSFVPEINRDLDKALSLHLNGPMMVLDAISRLKRPLSGKILVVGSASEYGEFPSDPVGEEHPSHPRDHYGLIKLALRHAGLHYFSNHGLPVIHIRQFNVTGPEQDGRFVLPSICRQVALAPVGSRQRIVVGNTAVSRDFLSVTDVCEAYRTLILSGEAGSTYNVCSGRAYKIEDLIALAAELRGVGVDVEVSDQLLRENDKVQSIICGDPARIMKLGWAPRTPMRELLSQMIAHHVDQPQPIREH